MYCIVSVGGEAHLISDFATKEKLEPQRHSKQKTLLRANVMFNAMLHHDATGERARRPNEPSL